MSKEFRQSFLYILKVPASPKWVSNEWRLSGASSQPWAGNTELIMEKPVVYTIWIQIPRFQFYFSYVFFFQSHRLLCFPQVVNWQSILLLPTLSPTPPHFHLIFLFFFPSSDSPLFPPPDVSSYYRPWENRLQLGEGGKVGAVRERILNATV